MKKRQVVVTGIGTVNAVGRGMEAVWRRVLTERLYLTRIGGQEYFDPATGRRQSTSQVPDEVWEQIQMLTAYMLNYPDRCAQLTFAAALDALDSARVSAGAAPTLSSGRIRIMLATIDADGIGAVHAVRNSYTRAVAGEATGAPTGSPVQVKSDSRTFISGRISGAHAIIKAAQVIRNDQADLVLAGGTDAPLTSPGMLMGEGATLLVLEEYEQACRRGASILAELQGWATGSDISGERSGIGLLGTIEQSLSQAAIGIEDITIILPHGAAMGEGSDVERAVLTSLFGSHLFMTIFNAGFGHLQATATPLDLALAIWALRHRMAYSDEVAANHADLAFLDGRFPPGRRPLGHALILAKGWGGMLASVVIRTPPIE